jgi:hypothetical protein
LYPLLVEHISGKTAAQIGLGLFAVAVAIWYIMYNGYVDKYLLSAGVASGFLLGDCQRVYLVCLFKYCARCHSTFLRPGAEAIVKLWQGRQW